MEEIGVLAKVDILGPYFSTNRRRLVSSSPRYKVEVIDEDKLLIVTYNLTTFEQVDTRLKSLIRLGSISSYLSGALLSVKLSLPKPTNGPYIVEAVFSKPIEGDVPPALPEVMAEDESIVESAVLYDKSGVAYLKVAEGANCLGQLVIAKSLRSYQEDLINKAIHEAVIQNKMESCYCCRLLNISFRRIENSYEVGLVMERLELDLHKDIERRKRNPRKPYSESLQKQKRLRASCRN